MFTLCVCVCVYLYACICKHKLYFKEIFFLKLPSDFRKSVLLQTSSELDYSGLFSTNGLRWWFGGDLGTRKEVRRFWRRAGEQGHAGKGGDYFKMLGPGNAFPVINAAETRGLDKLAYLAVREDSVELWDQKAEGEVLKKVEIRQAQQ